MPTRYCGPGGNDGNSGLTWVLRKLTLDGVEDTPVVAGDVVYVGPGVYRESLTCDVDGGAGNEIVYIGDVTGENTDGVGGLVRVTGSNNDQTSVRAFCILCDNNYRVFRGFWFNATTDQHIAFNVDAQNNLVEDCAFTDMEQIGINILDAGTNNITIRRCVFFNSFLNFVYFQHGATVDNVNGLVENCLMFDAGSVGVRSDRVGGIIVRNCHIQNAVFGAVRPVIALSVGQTMTVNNCTLINNNIALQSAVVGQLIEDFNNFYINQTDRNNVAVGANSVSYLSLLQPPMLHSGADQASGFRFPWWFGELSEWSQVRAIVGSNEPVLDMLGITRPVTANKNSWGPLQFDDMERDTSTVRTGISSLTLNDAGCIQFTFPVTARPTIILVYVQREVNYAGTNPQMIIKQPGQADRTTTDTGAAGAWNLLRDVFTPAADPPYVMVELASLNTAAAGNYAAYFDDLRGRVA